MKIAVLLLFGIMVSCSSKPNKLYTTSYRQSIVEGECEYAQNNVPLEKDDTQFLRIYQGTIGYVAYVSTLPVTVGLDFILMGRCRYGCPNETKNMTYFEMLFPTSVYTYESTKDIRCPDTSYYVQKFLEISECFEKRADKVSLQKSLDQLDYLVNEFENGPTCIRIRDADVAKKSRERVIQKISAKSQSK